MRAAPAPTPTPTSAPMMSDFINIIRNIIMPFNSESALRDEIHLLKIDGSHVDGHIQLHAEGASFAAQKEE